MKTILAIALSLFTFAVHAVDVTLTLTPPHMARAQTAVGDILNLRTADTPANPNAIPPTLAVPGVPRDATPAEVKTYMATQLRVSVQDYERRRNFKTAMDTVPAFTPQ